MISLFRRLTLINVLVLAIVAILLRIGFFFNPPKNLDFSLFESYASVLFDLPTNNIFSVQSNLLIALVLTFAQALLFNKIVNEYNLLGKPTFLPALMYVTGTSLLMHFLVLSPVLICNFLLLWMLEKFLSIYKKESAQATMFDLGVIIGLGALLYLPFIAMMLLLWISLIIFRPFNWREWVAGVIGLFTVFFFIAVAYYWTDSIDDLQNFQVPLAIQFKVIKINYYNYAVLIPLGLILFLSVIALQQKLYRSYVHIRKSYLFLFSLFIISILSFFISSKYQIAHFLLAIPAVSVFMGFYFVSATKRWFYESLYLLLAGCVIYFQLV